MLLLDTGAVVVDINDACRGPREELILILTAADLRGAIAEWRYAPDRLGTVALRDALQSSPLIRSSDSRDPLPRSPSRHWVDPARRCGRYRQRNSVPIMPMTVTTGASHALRGTIEQPGAARVLQLTMYAGFCFAELWCLKS
jgi:hypothetical protein